MGLCQSERDELVRLRIEVRELRELLDEYQRAEAGEGDDLQRAVRINRWAERLRAPTGTHRTAHRRAARAIDALLAARGRLVTPDHLVEAIAANPDYLPAPSSAGSVVGATRSLLARLGVSNAIENERGVGWRMPGRAAARVLAALEPGEAVCCGVAA